MSNDSKLIQQLRTLIVNGDNDGAIALFYEKLRSDPDNIFIRSNLAILLHKNGLLKKAAEEYKHVLLLDPNHYNSLNNLSAVMRTFGNFTQANKLLQKAITINPNNPEGYTNIGTILIDCSLTRESIEPFQKALRIKPDYPPAISNLLLATNYFSNDPKLLCDLHKSATAVYKCKIIKTKWKYNKQNKIRIGYISADFRQHSCAYFLEPIFEHHNKNTFEIFCYSDVISPDNVTLRFKNKCDKWHDSSQISNHDLSKIIKNDNLDILIDCSGHTNPKRIPLLAKKPAPIQVTYLGYPNTTGLSSMDYRLTDIICDPADMDQWYTEKLIKMQNCFLCYKTPYQPPVLSLPPFKKNGYITFGSFNNLPKLSAETINIWSTLLTKLPNSKLVLKSRQYSDQTILSSIKDNFRTHGISTNRIIFLQFTKSVKNHLELYAKIDIALDTFPYNGTTTTCEALLMGVPIITRTGNTHASRVTASILNQIQLYELITTSDDAFISSACMLALDHKKLTSLHKNLRSQFMNSSICDGSMFVKNLEKIYLKILTARI